LPPPFATAPAVSVTASSMAMTAIARFIRYISPFLPLIAGGF
jgi:hypothetical protein